MNHSQDDSPEGLFRAYLDSILGGLSIEGYLREHPEARQELELLLKADPELGSRGPGPGTPGGLFAKGATLAGRYEVRDRLAEGGMGTILSAWDRELEREVALKVMKPVGHRLSLSNLRRRARFEFEARVTSRLEHPSVVSVFGAGVDPAGNPFFAMQLVRGNTLEDVFTEVRAGTRGQKQVVGMLMRACEAVAYAHEQGVIHRDLKPRNVMVGTFGEILVMDWGLARYLEAPSSVLLDGGSPGAGSPLYRSTVDGQLLGTPAYMPPEQAAGRVDRVGRAADVYSLGAMLYQLLAGHEPYGEARSGPKEVLRRIAMGPPEPVPRSQPRELRAIVAKAMAREPGERYPSATELAEELAAYLEGRAVGAHRLDAIERARKWVLRNKRLAVAMAALLAIVVLAFELHRRSSHLRVQAAELAQRRVDEGYLDALDETWQLYDTPRRQGSQSVEWLGQQLLPALAQAGIDPSAAPDNNRRALERVSAVVRDSVLNTLQIWNLELHEHAPESKLIETISRTIEACEASPIRRPIWEAIREFERTGTDNCDVFVELSRGNVRGRDLVLVARTVKYIRGQDAATDLLTELASQAPDEFWVQWELGRVEGPWKLEALRSAWALRPDSATVAFTLAADYHLDGRTEEAVALYREVIELDPEFTNAYSNLMMATGDLEASEQLATLAEAVAPPTPLFLLNRAYQHLSRNENFEAIDAATQGLQLGGGDHKTTGLLYLNLGQAYWRSECREEAITNYRAAVPFLHRYPVELAWCHYSIAYNLERMGDRAGALEASIEACMLGSDLDFTYTLARSLFLMDRVEDSLAFWESTCEQVFPTAQGVDAFEQIRAQSKLCPVDQRLADEWVAHWESELSGWEAFSSAYPWIVTRLF